MISKHKSAPIVLGTVLELRPLMQAYLEWVKMHKRLSESTCRSYARDLQLLVQCCQRLNILVPESITAVQVRHMIMQLHGAGQGAKSIARYLSSWRSWFTWLVQNGHVPSNPVKTIRAPKTAKDLPKVLSVDDAVHLVGDREALKNSQSAVQTLLLLRDYALIELLYSSGLRVSEFVGLDIAPPAGGFQLSVLLRGGEGDGPGRQRHRDDRGPQGQGGGGKRLRQRRSIRYREDQSVGRPGDFDLRLECHRH